MNESQIEAQPEESQVIAPPPPPPAIKAPQIPRGRGPVQPVTYETTIKQTVSPSTHSNNSLMDRFSNLHPSRKVFAANCYKLFYEKPEGWKIVIVRFKPEYYEYTEPIPQGPYEEIIEFVRAQQIGRAHV